MGWTNIITYSFYVMSGIVGGKDEMWAINWLIRHDWTVTLKSQITFTVVVSESARCIKVTRLVNGVFNQIDTLESKHI